MKRRQFIQQSAWLTGGLLAAACLPAEALAKAGLAIRKVKGKVLSNGKGVKGVVVSDGYSVVATNAAGKYEMPHHPDAMAVFISTPAGYAFAQENGITRHYRLLKDLSLRKSINFELAPLDIDDQEHQFIIWADPQVRHEQDVEKLMAQSVPDTQAFVEKAGKSALLHGITVGDIVWDNLALFQNYNEAVGKTGIPFFQCIGNHDMDYNKGEDDKSDDTFQQWYGPTYYSFNRGKVHYVVMDDVRYLGKDRLYDGHIAQHQLDWLKKDLEFVPQENLIVLCVHIPVHNGVKNNLDLYAVLGTRKVHIMSGHTHYHRNVIIGNVYEHNHGTVCGAWWTGPVCGDGTPCGYGVYQVKGTELSWQYKTTGQSLDHQMSIRVQDSDPAQKQLQLNVWNYDPSWKLEYYVDEVQQSGLERYTGLDLQAEALYKGPDLPKPRGFAEPVKTDHLFKGNIPATAKQLKVVATDPFGKQYSVVHNV